MRQISLTGRRMGTEQQLAELIAKLHHRYGTDAIQPLEAVSGASYVSTGFPQLDHLIPQAQLTAFSGLPTSGATTVSYHIMAQQARVVAYVDLARHFDAEYAAHCGVDIDQVLLLHPVSLEHALAITHDLILLPEIQLVVFDAGFERDHPALDAMRRIVAAVHQARCTMLWLNLGNHSTAVSDVAAVRLSFARLDWCVEDDEVVGYQTQVTVLKHKFGQSGQRITVDIYL